MNYDELVKMLRTCSERDSCVGWDIPCPYLGTGLCDDKAGKAADAIEEMQRIVRQLDKHDTDLHNEGYDTGYFAGRRDYEPKWISVKERLPEPYSWVLGFGFGETEMPIEVFYDGSEWKDSVLGGWYITHWMPLPTPPKEDEA